MNFALIATASFIGVAIALLGLNFYHASNCSQSKSTSEIDSYVDALNKRLLQAESQSLRNTVLVNKLLHLVQVKLHQIEAKDIEELSSLSQDEAVRLALLLAANPAPPMPEFEINSKYKDSEELADLIDDIFKNVDDKDSGSSAKYSYSYGSSKDKDYEGSKDLSVTDAEAEKQCAEWKDKYSVVMGVSWGNLPYDLQQKWLHYSCDYHLSDSYLTSKTGKEDSSSETVDDKFSSADNNNPSSKLATPGPTDDKDDFFV